MTSQDLTHIRNIGIIAHIDAGKTTTTESILHRAGKIHRTGHVDDGTTQMDWMAQERERGITITSAATTCNWQDHTVNIIDTPGHIDFTAEVERSLRVLDGAVVVFCGVGGVEPQSESVWLQADRYRVPRIAYVNKIDRDTADFDKVVEQMRERFRTAIVPIQRPYLEDGQPVGIIDLCTMKLLTWEGPEDDRRLVVRELPPAEADVAQVERQQLLETIIEEDAELMERHLDAGDVPEHVIYTLLRKATLAGRAVPVLCGSSARKLGIEPLLDAITHYLPCPMDVPPVEGTNPATGKSLSREASDSAPLACLAFKVVMDPHVGRLTYLRVYSGRLTKSGVVYNPRTKGKERTSRILEMHANKRQELEEAIPGAIVAVVGLKDTGTGDTLCDIDAPILLEHIAFPEPVISVAIHPEVEREQEEVVQALTRLAEEDPTLTVRLDPETSDVLLSGMGELHLEIVIDRARRELGVKAQTGPPAVSYKETVTAQATAWGNFVKQTGGHGHFAKVCLRVEPLERNRGIEIVNEANAGALPEKLIPFITRGIQEELGKGVVEGYPVQDVRVVICDGRTHAVDSAPTDFKVAAGIGFRSAMRKAAPWLLEPLAKLELVFSEEALGAVTSDLGTRRAQIQGVVSKAGSKIIRAQVPVAEMFGYATSLRSLTQGRGTFTMEVMGYDLAPGKPRVSAPAAEPVPVSEADPEPAGLEEAEQPATQRRAAGPSTLLQFHDLAELVAEHTVTEPGQELAEKLGPLSDLAKIRELQAELAEMRRLRSQETALPVQGAADAKPYLDKVERGEALSAEEFAELASALEVAGQVAQAVETLPPDFPQLKAMAEGLGGLSSLQNALALAALDEEMAATRNATKALGERSGEVAKALKALGHLDLVHAKAILSESYQMTEPKIAGEGVLRLRGLRSPLLLQRAAGDDTVDLDAVTPATVILGSEVDLLLITGPPGGGKTELLKAIGLAALMARAGLHIPTAEDSTMPFFARVLVDVCPEESDQPGGDGLADTLRRLSQILEKAGPSSLVLLDDLGEGASPAEGRALGEAIMERLVGTEAKIVVTTSCEALVQCALRMDRARVAELGFNPRTGKPSFRLSSPSQEQPTLAAAEQSGVPADVVSRAKDLLRRRDRQPKKEPESERKRPGAESKAPRREPRTESRAQPEPPQSWPPKVGDQIYVPRFGKRGEVFRIDPNSGEITVRVDGYEIETTLEQLKPRREDTGNRRRRRPRSGPGRSRR